MADVHTGLGHDLPEYAARSPRTRVQIFRDGDKWAWYHICGRGRRRWHWDSAMTEALAHLGRCSK